ncbi:LSU ribosomal protein L18p (L5e) [Liberibacter crescens BT-1]|uniref:Large ribosomal subunit protein uL18 n=1 Tax=Liberibacter crescens (strain BT-1) TaxID=1215343 RepID=L0EUS6_LIBCB|nr:50S ribosomal protein L18 [Liberibacter crescens]AGA64418.1 LSU ribosomal protein L18p (L5e) [Liberibacter crescens BT-1]AMC12601.1 50S ribosomal protein L18 [Liberibacter crescens]
MASRREILERRASRVRRNLKLVSKGRLRLSVYRSSKNIYAQIIDDNSSCTLVSASSLDKDIRNSLNNGSNIFAASVVGKLIAERAVQLGIKEVSFDRGAFIFHGRIEALAEAAREGGLSF